IAHTFSKKELLGIAEHLGQFLTALHSFPTDKIKELEQYNFEPLPAWQERLDKLRKIVFPHIPQDEQQWIEKLFTDFFQIIQKSSIRKVVTHGDIMPEHIIVDPKTHTLSGII